MPVSPCSPRPWLAVALFGLLYSVLAPAHAAAPVDDAVEASIAGEFALSAGKLDEAARWYLEAARASDDDAGLAERASRIALLADDDARAGEALALWRARAPQSLALREGEVTLALRRND